MTYDRAPTTIALLMEGVDAPHVLRYRPRFLWVLWIVNLGQKQSSVAGVRLNETFNNALDMEITSLCKA
jgi:hypothetical protein